MDSATLAKSSALVEPGSGVSAAKTGARVPNAIKQQYRENTEKGTTSMITINAVSGGATSAYMAVHYPADYNLFCLVCTDQAEVAPKDKGLLREVQKRVPGFIASRELDHTLKLVLDLEQMIGNEIIWLTAKTAQSEARFSKGTDATLLTYDRLLAAKGGESIALPNKAQRWCTTELKLVPQIWWRYLNIAPNRPVIMNVGLRADEDARVKGRLAKCDRADIPTRCDLKSKQQSWLRKWHWREQDFPLWRDGITKADVVAFWQAKGWQFPGMPGVCPKLAALSGNCDMCFFKQAHELKTMAALESMRYGWAIEKEELADATFITDLSYEEIRDLDEATLKRLQKSRAVERNMRQLERNGQQSLLNSLLPEDKMCACTD